MLELAMVTAFCLGSSKAIIEQGYDLVYTEVTEQRVVYMETLDEFGNSLASEQKSKALKLLKNEVIRGYIHTGTLLGMEPKYAINDYKETCVK